MNTIIGRITRDAVVKNVSDDRQVVEFSVAVNDFYKKKGAEKGTTVTNYYNCSFWLNAKSAERLKKSTLVQLFGRLTVNAYTDLQDRKLESVKSHEMRIMEDWPNVLQQTKILAKKIFIEISYIVTAGIPLKKNQLVVSIHTYL